MKAKHFFNFEYENKRNQLLFMEVNVNNFVYICSSI